MKQVGTTRKMGKQGKELKLKKGFCERKSNQKENERGKKSLLQAYVANGRKTL